LHISRVVGLAIVAAAALSTAPGFAATGMASGSRFAWMTGTHHLADSNGFFTVPRGGAMVLNDDAVAYDERTNAEAPARCETGAISSEPCEAIIVDGAETLYLSYRREAFVRADDWMDVFSEGLVARFDRAIASDKCFRRTKDSCLAPVRWLEHPSLDPDRGRIEWTLAMVDGVRPYAVSFAFAFGRFGVETFTLISETTPNGRDRTTPSLEELLNDFHFGPEGLYSDHQPGDPTFNLTPGRAVAFIHHTFAASGRLGRAGHGRGAMIINIVTAILLAAGLLLALRYARRQRPTAV
jgi:Protein of unknown function (DUF2167)